MNKQKEKSLRNAISYCIENNDVNKATSKIIEFIRDEIEAITVTHCCKTLRDKETPTFEEWLKLLEWEQIGFSYVYKQGRNYKDIESLKRDYKMKYNL